MCASVSIVDNGWKCPWRPEGCRIPADELTGTGEPRSRDAMNQIQDVCNSNMHS